MPPFESMFAMQIPYPSAPSPPSFLLSLSLSLCHTLPHENRSAPFHLFTTLWNQDLRGASSSSLTRPS